MRLRTTVLLLAAAGLSSAGSAFAQPTQVPAEPTAKKMLDPSEVVCEKQEVLGSRVATKRICMTRSQWADLRSQDRQEIEKVQTRRGMNDR